MPSNYKTETIICVCENGGERLDVFLASNLCGLTRSAAQRLLEAGRVTLNGKPVKKNHIISANEHYTVIQDEPEDSVILKQDIPLDIVFEDDDVIVVNKPKGMVVHPAPGHPDGTLVNALLYHCGDSLSGIGGIIRPGIVHRIDKDTSGLIIAAKNDYTHVSLAEQLSSRTLTREYQAIVCGNIKSDNGRIDAPIGRHPTDRKKQAVIPESVNSQTNSNSRPAITHYDVIARYGGYTHVWCRLETGRTHQIRVHMAHVGHPVLGDIVYGRKKPDLGMSSQCLHAWKLEFMHPTNNESVELYADLPDYFVKILSKLEKQC
ncbi:MAG: RluA family pseudouridine synthase [Oscillospiraceae bacterium]|nr:RluA family pseudouridine synthase [Oscillospiraceae bacterium]